MGKKKTGAKGNKKNDDNDDYWNSKEMEVDNLLMQVKETESLALHDYSDAPVINADELLLAAADAEEEEEAAGSLMAMVKKQSKKGKKNPTSVLDASPLHISLDDDLDGDECDEDLADENDDESGQLNNSSSTLKSAKQKLKEKKEREKELKKKKSAERKAANAAKKAKQAEDEDAMLEAMAKEKLKIQQEKEEKKQKNLEQQKQQQQTKTITTSKPDASENLDEEEDEDDDANAANSTAAKNKKKKKKKKADDLSTVPPTAAPGTGAGGKKNNAVIAALREQMLARQKAEEEARLAEEEERKRIEEEERRIEEEKQMAEEAKKRKKEKEKARIEQLKKEGKWQSKAEKEKAAKAKARLEQLKAAGMVIGPEASGDTTTDSSKVEAPKPKRVIYEKKKKRTVGADTSTGNDKLAPGAKKSETLEKSETLLDSWEDAVADSWEDAMAEDKENEKSSDETKVAIDSASGSVDSLVKKSAPPTKKPKSTGQNEKLSSPNDDESEDDSEDDSGDSDSEGESSDSEDEAAVSAAEKRKQESRDRRQARMEEAMSKRSKDNLRSPICCILGHVDTGKTKLLDKIRQTNVQEGEAGGITQQIGATYFPGDAIKQKVGILADEDDGFEIKVPGLLIIDTPGHESFTNLRSRGSSLCNIAILVVDIMHGLEPQTLESLGLLKLRKTPFIVALNKIDRLYGWEAYPNMPFKYSFERQKDSVKTEYNERLSQILVAFAEQGFNAKAYYENDDFRRNVSLVPTSAITGEGIPDMLKLVVSLTQKMMADKLMYLSELECTVLEVKVIEGLGTTIDVILSNGVLKEGDRICICGLNGPIVTNIRALLTPQPLRELRVKSQYVHHKTVKAALGVKICANDLEKAIAGSRLMVIGPEDDEEEVMEEVMSDLTKLMSALDKSGRGVCVQASTLGSLEALLSFLKDCKIPVSGIQIGPVHRKDVRRAAVMLEHAREYAVLLAFDVKIDKDANDLAAELGVKIFSADIIYHLFDKFTAYMNELLEQKRRDMAPTAVFPCILKIVPSCVFNTRSPIIVGVDVIEGTLRVGTPLCVPMREFVTIGKVSSIELNHKQINEVKKGGPSVAIKIDCPSYETPKMVGRHFLETDELYSKISRNSIDVLKESFRDDMSKDDWQLIIRMKKVFNIS